ncbi:TonB-dependent receptor [Sphingomonas oligophenolica]|uniref:TonB-dependent receptor n=2 Tax=Sphingomonas oligophenolica TaxID=301154 RepID=A0ABU9Y293_9SPHN
MPHAALAQADPQKPADTSVDAQSDAGPDVIVTGIRASLERSIDIKRNSTGVVDAISAEDIGKFPDTNLAESLQRVTGVSINRVNGEGSQVTVRGFGPGYNLVTLNGRTLAATDIGVVGGDGNADGATGSSRSFDFDNLASESVRTLEVYKTARAAVPSGGIGATINVVTRRPLDHGQSGFSGSIGAKAVYDSSTRDCIDCGSHVTPEVTGLLSWADDADTFGVTLFGSYQKRNFSVASTGGNDWNIVPYSTFLGYTNASTQITNAPTNPNTLVAVPNDSRSDFSEDSRERINGQGVVQFKPTDSLTITADALYARNRQSERRSDSGNWFNRPFDVVKFDGNPVINSAVYLHEVLSPTKDGPGSENQYRATKSTLQDYGLNLAWDVTDNFHVGLDGHISLSDTLPDNPNGNTSTLVAIAGYGITAHSVDYSSGVPVQIFDFNDTASNGSTRQGNRNGVLDIGDIGTQVGRTYTSTQTQRLKEVRLDAGWDLGGGSRFDFGGDYRTSKVRSTQVSTYQPLGDWGVANPGDVVALAPGQLFEFCLPCKFHSLDLQATGNALKAFRVEDAAKLYSTLTGHFAPPSTNSQDNRVQEDIWAAYGQLTWSGKLANMNANLVAGIRYERTTSTSASIQQVPLSIRWDADNDFTVVASNVLQSLVQKSHYSNVMPSMDFRLEFTDKLVGRFSFGRTIARTDYSNLFSATSVGGPGRPTAIGGFPTASSGNPSLIPLVSDNIDASLEYYFKPGSYLSLGFFDKRVKNFVGTGITDTPLFGLTDPSSGAAGTRSGAAKAALTGLGADLSDVNLFTMTALIDQTGSTAAATSQFSAHYNTATRSLEQSYVDTILTAYNISGNSSDPAYVFKLSKPINNREVEVWGFELAGSYFLGDTGLGVAAAYTYVRSNAKFDNGADPSIDQFALAGLSDTANVTLIYDKHGISARFAYNWRAKFLSQLNRDGYKSPLYTEPHGQFDLNVSYDITPKIAVSLEAINLTEQGIREYGRTPVELFFAQEQQRRFMLGARYKF